MNRNIDALKIRSKESSSLVNDIMIFVNTKASENGTLVHGSHVSTTKVENRLNGTSVETLKKVKENFDRRINDINRMDLMSFTDVIECILMETYVQPECMDKMYKLLDYKKSSMRDKLLAAHFNSSPLLFDGNGPLKKDRCPVTNRYIVLDFYEMSLFLKALNQFDVAYLFKNVPWMRNFFRANKNDVRKYITFDDDIMVAIFEVLSSHGATVDQMETALVEDNLFKGYQPGLTLRKYFNRKKLFG